MSSLIRDALVIERLGTPINSDNEGTPVARLPVARLPVVRLPVVRLLVELEPASSCQRCARGEGCGAGLLAAASRPVRLMVDDRLGARVGQRVQIEGSSGSNWLRVVAGAYGLPTLGLLLGVTLPRMMGVEAEWVAMIGAALGLCSTIVLWQRVIEPRLRASSGSCQFGVIETAHTVSIERPEVS